MGKVWIKFLLAISIIFISTSAFAKTYTVERVVDGDTLKLTNGERIRLIGIDTPESKPNDKAKRDSERSGQDLETTTKMGQEATKYTKLTLLSGENKIRLEYDTQRQDRYGRTLAYVYIPGKRFHVADSAVYAEIDGVTYTFLNAALVAHGYATPMTIPPNVKHAELFKELYVDARKNKRGLWNEEDYIGFSTEKPSIEQIQRMLSELGYNIGIRDGDIDRRFREAIVLFQKQNRLAVSGFLDNSTWEKLKQLHQDEAESRRWLWR